MNPAVTTQSSDQTTTMTSRTARPPIGVARLALLSAILLSGLSAGFFFTYEASVTLALADVSDPTYTETFKAINETVRNPAFGLVFFGSVPAIVLAIAANWSSTSRAPRSMLAAALALYLGGVMVTGTGNVPLNEELAGGELTSPSVATEARENFEDDWNLLNLIRSVAIGASFVLLTTTGLVLPSPRPPGDTSMTRQNA